MPPGLISTRMNRDDPLAGIAGYDPERIALDEQKDTVQGQLQSIFSKDSPLLQGARTRAAQTANARGLLNSSMAVQAGEEATYNAALPIAQQDASTSFNERQLNQAAANRGFEFTAGAGNVAALQERSGQQQLGSIAATGAQQRLGIGAQSEAESRLLSQKAEIDRQMQTADAATKERLLAQSGALDRQLQELRGTQQIGAIGATSAAESRLLSQKAEIDRQMQTADAATRERLLAQSGALDRQLQELRGTQETGLQQLRGTQAQELAQIEASYKTLMQSSASASQFFSMTATAIGEILKEPTIPVEQKQQLIQKQMDLLKNGMAVIGGISNLDLQGLLTFEAVTSAG